MIKCFIDTETGGLDHKVHGLHQVAAIILDANDNEIDQVDLKFRPSKERFEQAALDKCGLDIQDVKNRPLSHNQAFELFTAFLEKHVNRYEKSDKLQFVAYNSAFDEGFIRQWFEDNNNDFYGAYFWSPSICIQKASAFFLRDVRNQINRFKLCFVCEFAQIEFDEAEAHDALYDIRKTVELYRKLI
jgi:DNA polymerase III alpha subunit (gram-positive type)